MSLSEEKQSEVIEAFSSTSRYLDDLLNIDNDYFDGFISQIYRSELQLNKANSFKTQAPFLAWAWLAKNGKRKVQGVPQSQTAALPRPQEEEETDKSKQAQIEQTYEKH